MTSAYRGGQPGGTVGRDPEYATAYSTWPTVSPSYSCSAVKISHTAIKEEHIVVTLLTVTAMYAVDLPDLDQTLGATTARYVKRSGQETIVMRDIRAESQEKRQASVAAAHGCMMQLQPANPEC